MHPSPQARPPERLGDTWAGGRPPLLTLLARPPQQHVVVLHLDAEALGEIVDRPLEAGVVEGDQAAAIAADQMVVVGAARIDRLEARLAGADRDPLREPVLDEQVQHAVDAGAADRRALRAEGVLDLDRAERAGLAREQLDHALPGSTALMACAGEHSVDVLAPRRRLSRRHGCDLG